MSPNFWRGFVKAAEVLSEFEDQLKPDTTASESNMLQRTISKAGPKLADLTEESDRSKFRVWKG